MEMPEHKLSRIEQEIYDLLFKEDEIQHLFPDKFIFLDTDRTKCLDKCRSIPDCRRLVFDWDYLVRCDMKYRSMPDLDVEYTSLWSDVENLEMTIERLKVIIGEAVPRPQRKLEKDLWKLHRPRVISIEGNVGAGKTTLIQALGATLQNERKANIAVLQEPVGDWLKITNGKDNILHLFYQNPTKYAFMFQALVGITTMLQLTRIADENPALEIILSERSLLTTQAVFAESLIEAAAMDTIEAGMYQKIFDDELIQWMYPKGIIYLKTDPSECLERIAKRGRIEERNITEEWLERCQHKHEKMLDENAETTNIELDGNSLHPSKRERKMKRIIEWCEKLQPGIFDTIDATKELEPVSNEIPTANGSQESRTPVKVRHKGMITDILMGEWSYDTLIERIKDCFRDLRHRGKQFWLAWSKAQGKAMRYVTNDKELLSAVHFMEAQPEPMFRFGIIMNEESGEDHSNLPRKLRSSIGSHKGSPNLRC
jgi:deoxyadenosine/deoxycytidine kinase